MDSFGRRYLPSTNLLHFEEFPISWLSFFLFSSVFVLSPLAVVRSFFLCPPFSSFFSKKIFVFPHASPLFFQSRLPFVPLSYALCVAPLFRRASPQLHMLPLTNLD